MTKQIILDRRIAADTWSIVADDADLPSSGDIIVSLARWTSARDALAARGGRTGVWLKPDDEPAELAADVAALPLVAVEFPAFTDGRGYSTGRLLRERYGFKGELRAVGDVLRDQLFLMARVGFNAFALKEGKSIDDALAAFADFSETYQSATDQPVPHYRRRLAKAAA
jgi:uncharacterized protein (DUF934 family)